MERNLHLIGHTSINIIKGYPFLTYILKPDVGVCCTKDKKIIAAKHLRIYFEY